MMKVGKESDIEDALRRIARCHGRRGVAISLRSVHTFKRMSDVCIDFLGLVRTMCACAIICEHRIRLEAAQRLEIMHDHRVSYQPGIAWRMNHINALLVVLFQTTRVLREECRVRNEYQTHQVVHSTQGGKDKKKE